MKKTFILVAAIAFSQVSYAETIPEVQDFLSQEIEKLHLIASPVGDHDKANASPYVLSKFALRLRAEVGFDIGIGDLKIVPGIELGWE